MSSGQTAGAAQCWQPCWEPTGQVVLGRHPAGTIAPTQAVSAQCQPAMSGGFQPWKQRQQQRQQGAKRLRVTVPSAPATPSRFDGTTAMSTPVLRLGTSVQSCATVPRRQQWPDSRSQDWSQGACAAVAAGSCVAGPASGSVPSLCAAQPRASSGSHSSLTPPLAPEHATPAMAPADALASSSHGAQHVARALRDAGLAYILASMEAADACDLMAAGAFLATSFN